MSPWSGGTALAKLYLGYVRKTPDHPFKLRIARRISRALFRDEIPVVAPAGASLIVSPEDWIGRQILFHGQYESKTLACAARLMAAGGLFLDVGACFGLYSCCLGILPGVRCIAIEPSAEAFVQLRRNLALNPSVSAALYHVAATPRSGLASLSFPDATNIGKARIPASAAEPAPSYAIGGVPLRDILKREEAGAVRLVKIDVEGMEMAILRSLNWCGLHRPEHVIMELNANAARVGESAKDCIAFFAAQGYEPRTVEGLPWRAEDPLPESNVWFRGGQDHPASC